MDKACHPLRSTDVAQYAQKGGVLWDGPAYFPSFKVGIDNEGVDGDGVIFPNSLSRHAEEGV